MHGQHGESEVPGMGVDKGEGRGERIAEEKSKSVRQRRKKRQEQRRIVLFMNLISTSMQQLV